jgi:hypothetical protein
MGSAPGLPHLEQRTVGSIGIRPEILKYLRIYLA